MEDINALSFISKYPMDKIVEEGTMTLVHPGAVGYTGGTDVNLPRARVASTSTPNNYGKALMMRAKFSVDGGTTWHEAGDELTFFWVQTLYYNGTPLGQLRLVSSRLSLSVGCNDSNVYARATGVFLSGSDIRVTITDPSPNWVYSGWTAVSQTITIKYWLFEL